MNIKYYQLNRNICLLICGFLSETLPEKEEIFFSFFSIDLCNNDPKIQTKFLKVLTALQLELFSLRLP